jgi:hypothetical protein
VREEGEIEHPSWGGVRLGCRNVLSFDAKPIPGLGLLHRTHWESLIGVRGRYRNRNRIRSSIKTASSIPIPNVDLDTDPDTD